MLAVLHCLQYRGTHGLDPFSRTFCIRSAVVPGGPRRHKQQKTASIGGLSSKYITVNVVQHELLTSVNCCLHDDKVLDRLEPAHQDGGRRGEAQGAGAGDHEHVHRQLDAQRQDAARHRRHRVREQVRACGEAR